MIKSYTDHAANERTFLAWLRTGVAIIAFGFLMDRFDLFVAMVAASVQVAPAHRDQLEHMSATLGHGVGQAFILVGIVFIVVATVRFLRIGFRLDDQKVHPSGIATQLTFSVALAVLLIAASVPLLRSPF